MKRFIMTERNGIYIVDLNQSLTFLDRAYEFVRETVAHGGNVLFVGTKKQAQEAIAEQATRVGMPYVNQRWLGGMLTNFPTMLKRIQKLKELESMNFDDVADRLMTMVRDVASSRSKVQVRRLGSFGSVPADVATNLSLVFTEVVQNALEHGLRGEAGQVTVRPIQEEGTLVVDVLNGGQPLPEDFSLAKERSLGLSIVTTLVADLDGSFEISSLPDGQGTRARIRIPLT